MNVFVDTNVLLDVLARREPFYSDSAMVWTLADLGRIKAFVSALSFPNLFYLLRRSVGRKAAWQAIAGMRHIFELIPVDAAIIHQAMDNDMNDLEDAIQFQSAMRAKATVLVTRNIKDFPRNKIVVQSPEAFLAAHFAN